MSEAFLQYVAASWFILMYFKSIDHLSLRGTAVINIKGVMWDLRRI